MRPLSEVEAKLCWRLWRQGKFGAGHMQIDTLVQGFPSHETGAARAAVAALLCDGILVRRGKARAAVHLNVRLAEEIRARIVEHPKFAWLPK